MCATFPAHLIFLDLIIVILLCGEYGLMCYCVTVTRVPRWSTVTVGVRTHVRSLNTLCSDCIKCYPNLTLSVRGVGMEFVYKMGGFHCIKADFWGRFAPYPSKRKKCIHRNNNTQKRERRLEKNVKFFFLNSPQPRSHYCNPHSLYTDTIHGRRSRWYV
jgi:hypothetical protein